MLKKNAAWIIAAVFAVGVIVALATPAQGARKDIGNAELAQLQSSGAFVVDVRTPSEYAAGHLPGAVSVPMGQLTQAAAAWNKNSPIVVYCATGARSANAATILSTLGFKKLYNLTDGIAAWNGQVIAGASDGSAAPEAPTSVKTDGKPLFIDFSGSA